MYLALGVALDGDGGWRVLCLPSPAVWREVSSRGPLPELCHWVARVLSGDIVRL